MRTIILFLLGCSIALGQSRTQNITGIVTDKQSQSPLIGVVVRASSDSWSFNTATNAQGKFTIKEVPIGRINIVFSYLGYRAATMKNILVDVGKETVVNIEMEESVNELKAAVISAKQDKASPNNESAVVSARSFTIEEATKYAGSLGDPSRMVTNFAGVGVEGDSRNDIVIRGNSPLGVLWRMEGIDIPNPNHFGSLGATGGPVSMLNSNVLSNSDFLTGAFPSEYGNAIAGAFDLRMRHGNTDHNEFTGQLGFNGYELGAEGPLGKNSNASYLINYRYSALGMFKALGINFGYGSIPQYQDLNFKLDFPLGNQQGRITVFGIGGLSYIALLAKDQKPGDFSVSPVDMDTYFGANTGVVGANYKYFFNEKTFQNIGIAASALQNKTTIDSLYNAFNNHKNWYGQQSTEAKYSITYSVNYKRNAKNTFNSGLILDDYNYNFKDSILHGGNAYKSVNSFNGNAGLLQVYTKWQHKFSDQLVFNLGLHEQVFTLNGSNALEPRAGLQWKFRPNQSLSAGFGMHSEIQPSYIYFYTTQYADGETKQTNKNLDFSKSNHFVVSYDNSFATNWRLKIETYYQQLYNIPVQERATSFSALNVGASYTNPLVDSLVNKGTGQNYGAEITLEKFFAQHYYALITASLFNSTYKGSDGIERSTAFNGNFIINALGGGEFELDKNKLHVLTFSTKLNYAGGKHYTAIDLAQSIMQGHTIYYDNQAFEKQYPDYFRWDVKIGYKLNGKKITQEWAMDIQNVLNTKNVFQQIYDPIGKQIITQYQLGLFPVGYYKINF